ncbi:hypothetical protein ABK040_015205 [Willaertia magna]
MNFNDEMDQQVIGDITIHTLDEEYYKEGITANFLHNKLKQKLCSKKIIPFSGEFKLVKKFEGLNKPYDLKVDDDFVFVADRNNKRICVFNKDLDLIKHFQLPGNPRGLCLDPHNPNIIYVSCGEVADQHKIFKLDKFSGVVLGSLGSGQAGNQKDQFYSPTCMVIDKDTYRMFVCEEHNNRITVISLIKEEQEYSFKTASHPVGIDITLDNCILVSEFNGYSITKYTKEGKFIEKVKRTDHPIAVKVDKLNGDIYICESWISTISVLDKNKKPKKSFKSSEFNRPYGLEIDDKGYVFVTAKESNGIYVFK